MFHKLPIPHRRFAVAFVTLVAAALGLMPSTASHAEAPTCMDLAVTETDVTPTNGPDVITGTPGDDVINGLGGADIIKGLGGNDVICGGGGKDILKGGDGRDSMSGDNGSDTMVGGADHDRAIYYGRTNALTASIDGVANDGEPGIGEADNVMLDVEGLYGGTGNDTLIGSATPNELVGSSGNDTLKGGGGNDDLGGGLGDDALKGGGGNDDLNGDDGSDMLDGGVGEDVMKGISFGNEVAIDTVTYASRNQPVEVMLDTVDNDGEGDEHDNVDPSVDNVIGGSGSDTITGSASANRIEGGRGNDILHGLGGADVILGQDHGDDMYGGDGADVLSGGNGTDTAHGGASVADVCTAEIKPDGDCEL